MLALLASAQVRHPDGYAFHLDTSPVKRCHVSRYMSVHVQGCWECTQCMLHSSTITLPASDRKALCAEAWIIETEYLPASS